LLFSILIVFLTRENPNEALLAIFARSVGRAPAMMPFLVMLLCGGLIVETFREQGRPRVRLLFEALAAFAGTVVFHAGFGLVKTSMPYIIPFWSDPVLANLDAALHFGFDPWQLAYGLADYLPIDFVLSMYLGAWAFPALCFPMLLATLDTDGARVRRYLLLFVFAWVLIGNVVALAFMSVGPVFYDLLLGTERFAGLISALATGPIQNTDYPDVQANLWHVYINNGQAFGSGISAFPSVHVSVAMVAFLYMAERSRWLAPVGFVFLLCILFLSVYTGYHYAVDGYTSILIMLGLNWVLKKREARQKLALASAPN
jgi:membrane-associated phospholipid phosphatase